MTSRMNRPMPRRRTCVMTGIWLVVPVRIVRSLWSRTGMAYPQSSASTPDTLAWAPILIGQEIRERRHREAPTQDQRRPDRGLRLRDRARGRDLRARDPEVRQLRRHLARDADVDAARVGVARGRDGVQPLHVLAREPGGVDRSAHLALGGHHANE